MRTHRKLMLAGLVAALAMATAVGGASANRLSVSHGNLFRVEWSSFEESAGGVSIMRCALTLEGSFHSTTIPKVRGLLIGNITHASIKNDPCSIGSATLLSETLPWHITYRGFSGTLPFITNVVLGLIGASLRLFFGGWCLVRTTTEVPLETLLEEGVEEGGGGNRIFRRLRFDSASFVRCVGVEGGSTISFPLHGSGAVRAGPSGSLNLLVKLI